MIVYGSPEYIDYTNQFDYEWLEDDQNYVSEDDVNNCFRYRISEDNEFIDVYDDGCVWYLKVDRIENFDRSRYLDHTLIGTKGIEHHAMRSLFKINK
jgi:hypothetical protein